jgi:hypothetical protein
MKYPRSILVLAQLALPSPYYGVNFSLVKVLEAHVTSSSPRAFMRFRESNGDLAMAKVQM